MSSAAHPDLPHFVAFGEALTDLVRTGADTWRSSCGGAPWNVAMAMAALGHSSAFGGGIGSDVFGQAIRRASAAAPLDLRFLQQFAKPSLLAIVHETDPPEYFFIGQDSADLQFRPENLPGGWLRALRWAHFGSLGLVREPLAARLLALAQGLKAEGKRISYDPNYRPLMDARYDEALEQMCRLADVIKVSDEDLRGLFRSPDHQLGLARISAWNPRAWLLLTRGAGPATLYRDGQEWQAWPPEVEVVDTVGAGDAAMAGLIHSLLRDEAGGGGDPARHLRWALAAGAAACMGAGAHPPTLAVAAALLA
ncbi:MAG: carbohydrate kinase, partial [Burkholderiaceae bacterium]